jgi:hypothetical protein
MTSEIAIGNLVLRANVVEEAVMRIRLWDAYQSLGNRYPWLQPSCGPFCMCRRWEARAAMVGDIFPASQEDHPPAKLRNSIIGHIEEFVFYVVASRPEIRKNLQDSLPFVQAQDSRNILCHEIIWPLAFNYAKEFSVEGISLVAY